MFTRGFTKQDLEEVLLAMDIFQRCAVILTIFEGMQVEEAATLLGADKDAVKAAQARGITEMTWRLAAIGPVSHRSVTFGRGAMVAFG